MKESMKSTRERILLNLVSQPHSTINDLANAVGISAISVRHHLSTLEAEGLVAAEEERHGVGRPRLLYNLTEKGLERFPTRYLRLTNRLLDQIKETMPQTTVTNIFTQMATDMADSAVQKARFMNTEGKLNLIKELLGQEGFMVEWEKIGNQYQIHEITCPYLHIGQSHPEVCSVDQTVISKILSIPAEKINCVLHGDAHCTYIIPNLEIVEKPA
jgi:DeoR family transcriptional regulator, suf operon transcriptional repressor